MATEGVLVTVPTTGVGVLCENVGGSAVQLVKLLGGQVGSQQPIPGDSNLGLGVQVLNTPTVIVSGGISVSNISTVATLLGTVQVSGTVNVAAVTAVSTVGTVLGTVNVTAVGTAVVSVVPGVSVVAQLSGVNFSTTALSGITGPQVWLGASQSVLVNTIAAGFSVTISGQVVTNTGVQAISGAVSISALPAVSISSTVPVSVVAMPPALLTTAPPSISAQGMVGWIAGGQSTTANPVYMTAVGQVSVNTAATIAGASITIQQGASVVAQLSGVNFTTTAVSGLTGPQVWLGASQSIIVNTIAAGFSVQALVTGPVSISVMPAVSISVSAVLGTIVTVLGTQIVSVAGASVYVTNPASAASGIGVYLVGLSTTALSGVTGPQVWLGASQSVIVNTAPTVAGASVTIQQGASVVAQLSGINFSTTALSGITGPQVWLGASQSVIVNTAPTVAGASVTIQQGASVVAQLSGLNLTTTATSGITGPIVWLGASQSVIVNTLAAGFSVQALVTGPVSISAMPAVSISVSAVLGTIVTVLGTLLVSVAIGSGYTTNPASAASGIGVYIVGLSTTALSGVTGPQVWLGASQTITANNPLVGGYWMVNASSSAMASSTQFLLMSVGISTGVTNATSAWTIGAGSVLAIYSIGFGVSWPAANQSVWLGVGITATGATLSTVALAYVTATYSTGAGAGTTFLAVGATGATISFAPGSALSMPSNTSFPLPWFIVGPAVVGVFAAPSSSGMTVYASVFGQILPTVPQWLNTGTVNISGTINTILSVIYMQLVSGNGLNTVQVTTGLANSNAQALAVVPKDYVRQPVIIFVSSTVVGSSTTMLFTIYTGGTSVTAGTSAWPVPAGKNLRIMNMNIVVQSSVALIPGYMVVLAGTAAASISVTATVGIVAALPFVPPSGGILGAQDDFGQADFFADVATPTTIGLGIMLGTSCSVLGAVIAGYLY